MSGAVATLLRVDTIRGNPMGLRIRGHAERPTDAGNHTPRLGLCPRVETWSLVERYTLLGCTGLAELNASVLKGEAPDLREDSAEMTEKGTQGGRKRSGKLGNQPPSPPT